ncbi:MAG TPA: metallophosphoesterase [Bacteroidales bacterium]|nr:metallophosphoesterase [Bacteroidales bacterium]
MNLITIGDLHGSAAWKRINPLKYDRVIFVGDYVDSGRYNDEAIYANLKSLIQWKEKLPDRIVLLWGNHDLAYFYGGHERHYCSGFRPDMLSRLFSFYTHYRSYFQAAFQINNYLWTHAGVVQRWFDHCIGSEVLPSDQNLAATLNRLFDQYYEPLYYVSVIRGGVNEDGGIFWAHRTETLEDPLKGYHQIVGHSQTHEGIVVADHFGPDTSVTYVDCLTTSPEFYKLEI